MTSDQQEYIITVHDPRVWDSGFWNELTRDGLGDNFIPTRSIKVVNERPFNSYSAHFALTAAEAQEIKKDPRVKNVELKADLQQDVKKEFVGIREGIFDKTDSNITSAMRNWGLLRSTWLDNDPFQFSRSIDGEYTYSLNGDGVDVIVIDSGVEPNHPEFAVNADGTGGSRVVDFNWASLGVPGVPEGWEIGGYLGDTDGHGSHCASVSAGNTQGWASAARIFSIRIFDGVDMHTGEYKGAIDSDLAFDLVKAFHLSKRASGNSRPTVCTNSWGYRSSYAGIQYTVWRGTQYNYTSPRTDLGQVYTYHPYSLDYITASVEDCASVGVIMVGAAGNYRHKIDVEGGEDYDNYYYWEWPGYFGEFVNYHLGSSPTNAPSMINVGAVENTSVQQKAYYSESGPRVDIYAPGSMIMGAYADSYYNTPAVADARNPDFYLNKLSGTSMACPQVAGVVACLLQARPDLTAQEVKNFLEKYAIKDELVDNGDGSYGDIRSLNDGANRILGFPYARPVRGDVNRPIPNYWISTSHGNTHTDPAEYLSRVMEGETFRVTLYTENVAPGTVVPYVVETVSENATLADLGLSNAQGQFVIGDDGSASITMNIVDELDAEGVETFRLRLAVNHTDVRVLFEVTDPPPVWDLVASATEVEEGGSVTFTINTINVLDGTVIPWELYGDGITDTDVDPALLTGEATIQDDMATVTISFPIDADSGDYETVTFRLDTPAPNLAVSVDILDRTPVYLLDASSLSPAEGDVITFQANTQWVPSGTTLYWTVAVPTDVDVSDFTEGTLSGTFDILTDIEGRYGSGSFQMTVTEDFTVEGLESFTVELRTDSNIGPVVATRIITIQDTSVPTYSITPSSTSISEGQSVSFIITTTGVPDGSTLYYSVTGTGIDLGDFLLGGLGAMAGSFGVNGGEGTVSFAAIEDAVTEGAETMTFSVSLTPSGPAVASVTVDIADTSTAP